MRLLALTGVEATDSTNFVFGANEHVLNYGVLEQRASHKEQRIAN
jgi:hypothetical protein